MQQPTAMYAFHQLQLKILDCTDKSARHANAARPRSPVYTTRGAGGNQRLGLNVNTLKQV